ncbi:MAG TPA: nucleoside deaminase [Longimicrobiales bacterium]|nr:nucleoside deaminase [Longimicrobiales bacterium]
MLPIILAPFMIRIDLPDWIGDVADFAKTYKRRDDRMRLAIALARENVLRDGGPFGAAVFESDSGRLVGVGVNRVVALNNSVLHAEMVAFMEAEARVNSYTLAAEGMPAHEIVTTCEPCAMCLGAALWSGVRRVICGATRQDAAKLQFDEGPVFPESHQYLEARGVEIIHEVLREEAVAVFQLYLDRGGPIYNA